MSKIKLNPSLLGFVSASNHVKRHRSTYTLWILDNYGACYNKEIQRQRNRAKAKHFKSQFDSALAKSPTDFPVVGIVGGGFAGLYAGLILQSFGIEFEIYENSDRAGRPPSGES